MVDGDAGVLPRLIGSVARLRHRQNTGTTDVGARQRINWVDGGVTWTVTDSAVNEEVSVSGTAVPSGAAGGDLTGTYPNPTLATAGPGATGPIGSSTVAPVITIDAKGRVTALTSATIASGPLGSLGYAQTTSLSQSYTSIANVTGLTVTATVTSGHRIRISGCLGCTAADTTGNSTLYIRESTTKLATVNFYMTATDGSGGSAAVPISAVVTPSAGSHTYVLSIERTTGTSCVATTSIITPAYILVEDVGT